MSSQNIEDFLTKQVLIDGHIVTYRSLSRQFSLHVNAAKNALAAFYVKSRSESKLVATYLVSGEVELDPQASDNMDIDDEGAPKDPEYEDDGAEEVQATEVVLVGEKDLEHTKSKFSTVFMVHVYSLSPAPIRDIGLICGPNEDVRKIDTQKGSEIAAKVGKIVGGDVKEVKGKYIPPPPAATTSGSSSTTKASSNVSSAIKRTGSTANITSDSKPKAIGLAGFFAKAGDTKGKKDATKGKEPKKPVKETAAKAKPASKDSEMEDNSSKASSKVKVKDSDTEGKSTAKTTSKRKQQESLSESDNEMSKPTTTTSKLKAKPPIRKGGTKRKSNVLLSESEDEEEPQKPPSGAESKGIVKKGQVVTNSEEESAPKASRAKDKGKGKQVVKEEDADVLAMMDVDDTEVLRFSRSEKPSVPDSSEPEDAAVDVEMDSEDLKPAPKTKKKPTAKTKKVVPVGKNGLKKKRVTKSKMKMDEKGYMVTEDYSSYESVDEEEPEPPKAKGKAKKGVADKSEKASVSNKKEKEASTKPKNKKKEDEEEGEETGNSDSATVSSNVKRKAAAPKAKPKPLNPFFKSKGK